jgi:saccharopine dehydrogenase (NAD+, L-lysine forming)
MINGGENWTTGSPRSSARQYRPASNRALDKNPRNSHSDSSALNVSLVALSLTNSRPKKYPSPRTSPTMGKSSSFSSVARKAASLSSTRWSNWDAPYEKTGVKLGDEQFALADDWAASGKIALIGMGVEPGLADVFARYATDHLFSEIDEIGIRDGANLTVSGYDFAPSFSIWTTIEECLNPPVIYEKDRGWFTTAPFSEPETFDFPEGIGPVECVNVEHEEVLLVPRWIDVNRVTFKYGLGQEFIEVLQTLHKLGLDRVEPVDVRGQRVSPRDVVAACLPDPAALGDRMRGRTCAGTWVRGRGKDGQPRSTYLYHVVDNEWCMREYGSQAVVWQTGVNPIVALELLDSGAWTGSGVLGPEAFDAVPFLDLLAGDYASPWGHREMAPA